MPAPGDVIDERYVVDELLGRGGMAEVYRAHDRETERPIALKLLHRTGATDTRRFRSEVDALRRLDHPGLVRLQGSGTYGGVPYLVLDLAEGPTLDQELAAGPLAPDRALTVAEQVAEALTHAHRRGVVHRDVKPSNILCDEHGRARLADFGIARLAGSPNLTGTGQLVGSAPYLAPEQVEGDTVGPPADVYALGLVVIECLTGTPCYPGGRIETAVARLHRPPTIPEGVAPWLGELLTAMTERSPGRRPSASAVAEAIRREEAPVEAATQAAPLPAAAGDTAVFPAGSLPVTPSRPRSGWPALAGLAAVLALVLGGWALASRDRSPAAPDPSATTTTVTTAQPATTQPPRGDQGDENGNGGNEGNGNGNGHRRGRP